MFAWGLVTGAHALITDKQGYLACTFIFHHILRTLSNIKIVLIGRACMSAEDLMMSPIVSNVLIGIAITEGGVIPATLLYLGSFYKSYELATRLAWFWGVQVRYRTLIHRFEA